MSFTDKDVFTELAGAGTRVKDYDFRIENLRTGKEAHWTIRYDFYTMPPAPDKESEKLEFKRDGHLLF